MDALPNSMGQERLESGDAWGSLHEIGHNFQEPRWTPKGTGEVTNNIFAIMFMTKIINLYKIIFFKVIYRAYFRVTWYL